MTLPPQVYQRGANLNLPLAGWAEGGVTIEAAYTGQAWSTIASNVSGAWSGTITLPAGVVGTLSVHIPGLYAVQRRVAFGDIFVIAGQSNATGQGTNSQTYTPNGVNYAALFGNDYQWREMVDPTDSSTNQIDAVSSDTPNNGSCWPLLATHYVTDMSLPCGFVPCAKNSSAIAAWLPGADHQNRATLYGSMVHRALHAGCKCVLWWQGEADALAGVSYDTYKANLATLADAIFADLGVKLMPAKLQNCSGIGASPLAVIQSAIADSWGVGNVLAGPDFSDLVTDDGYHLMTDQKLQTAADRWWTAIKSAFSW